MSEDNLESIRKESSSDEEVVESKKVKQKKAGKGRPKVEKPKTTNECNKAKR